MSEQYSGHQLPFDFVIQSRMFPLFSGFHWIKAFSHIKMEHRSISLTNMNRHTNRLSSLNRLSLDDGYWQRYWLGFIFPLMQNSPVSSDLSLDFEKRYISQSMKIVESNLEDPLLQNFENSSRSKSTIESFKSSISFKLPMEGSFYLNRSHVQNGDNIGFKNRFVRHTMLWETTFSTRPFANHTGNYQNTTGLSRFNPTTSSWGSCSWWQTPYLFSKRSVYRPLFY